MEQIVPTALIPGISALCNATRHHRSGIPRIEEIGLDNSNNRGIDPVFDGRIGCLISP
jgi:hypothetical protein